MSNSTDSSENVISVKQLTHRYSSSRYLSCPTTVTSLNDISFDVPRGSRVLLVGLNGAGKSTLLSILAGKKMATKGEVKVLNKDAFEDLNLYEDITYIGGPWDRGHCCDLPVSELLHGGIEDKRVQSMVKVLDVNVNRRISALSDGELQRCQIIVNMMKKKSVYILDEITTSLDLLAREGLLNILKDETEKNGATVIFATHIFDSMDEWPTHILYLRNGKIQEYEELANLQEFQDLKSANAVHPIFQLVKKWFTN